MPDNAVNDQDLARALDSVAGAAASLGGDSTATDTGATSVFVQSPSYPRTDPNAVPSFLSAAPAAAPVAPVSIDTSTTGPLDAIKKDALVELRPLVDKLNVSAEEKFDTYLLLIRSTDDSSLIAPAHDAAKSIADETRRAEALLDIIKEIDYLSQPKS